ncbi:MAG: hypothetical protein FWF57_04620 [Defluviitaleaceae bacterium]|nr:hypothetical protein [Defluviitaleaceae bacterium]
MTTRSNTLMKLMPHGIFEINEETAKLYGLSDGDKAKVVSIRGEAKAIIRITDRIPTGQVYSDFHHADTLINAVTQDALDPLAKEPELKACAVKIVKIDGDSSSAKLAKDEVKEVELATV